MAVKILGFCILLFCIGVEAAPKKEKSSAKKVPAAPEFNVPKSWNTKMKLKAKSSSTSATGPIASSQKMTSPPKNTIKPVPKPVSKPAFAGVRPAVPNSATKRPVFKSAPAQAKPAAKRIGVMPAIAKPVQPRIILGQRRPVPRPRPVIAVVTPVRNIPSPAATPSRPAARIAVQAFRNGNVPALKQFHRMADRNRDGRLTGYEVLKFSRDNFARYLDLMKVGRAFKSADTNNNGNLSVEELIIAVRRQLSQNNSGNNTPASTTKNRKPVIFARKISS